MQIDIAAGQARGMVFHLDVLKPSRPTEQASDAVHCAHTKEQMSLDLEDLW
ncbi:hypothetical protein PQR70_17720 [Paraburkholderia madseniana]|uniref:Uncharacterized protein n=1 Tax=Paraburkholderia madseniana TaxID=2599607 RepID=A0AAP5BCS6_9BURK|nr:MULTISPECIES: hypothetical protein [Paraburkholderia]MCX4146249.1 hypothetical protein [Paraburkholderia madseniana]MDN7149195.1 hypothetical protein [Paraburkholderia sp. WS6]MDQ6408075.1 hypothetical protein [Paraburkholderia madseniana]